MARGQARYWPDGRVNAVYPNGDGARDYATFTARYPEWVWRYYTSTGDRTTALRLYPSVAQVAAWLWGARRVATGLLYGLGDTGNGDPVYGYDLSVVADTASNVLAVNAFNRVAQLATLAGDDAGAATNEERAAQLTAAINGVLRRPDGTYVDGVDADGAQSASASQEANALALAYGVVPAADRRRRRRATWRASASTSGPTTASSSCARLAGGRHARGPGAHPHRCLHSRAGPTSWRWAGPSPGRSGSRATSSGTPCRTAGAPRRSSPCRRRLLGVVAAGARPTGRSAPPWRRRRPGWTAPGLGADGRRSCPGVVAAARRGHGGGPDGAGQRDGDGAAAGRRGVRHVRRVGRVRVREGGLPAGKAPGVHVVSAADGAVVVSVGSGSYRFTTA